MQRPDEPDIDAAPRHWCEICNRRTLFSRDLDGIPVCRECAFEEIFDE